MSDPQRYLLAIALGPVQDFIAASRKARDLFQGSDMLSQLSRTAAESLQADTGTELIFPTAAALRQRHAVANKLLVSTTSDPKALAATAKSAVDRALRRMWTNLGTRFDDLDKRAPGVLDRPTADRQLESFVEWYAAWTPYDPNARGGPDGYEARRLRVERLLAGRKTLRDFDRAHGVDGRPKSALDASRESVVDLKKDTDNHARRMLHLKGNEPLDAISLIKRLNGQERFVSAARVAIDPYLRAVRLSSDESYRLLGDLADTAGKLAVTDLAERFRTGEGSGLEHYRDFPYDCQLFYELSADSTIRQLKDWKNDDRYETLTKSAKSFYDTMRTFREEMHDVGEPPAYFAVLRADGDRMGAAIGNLGSKPAHQALSLQLGTFAEAAGQIVRDHFGAMIYSGGDDVLAFLPLDTALPCADALRKRFAAIIDEALKAHPEVEDPPTLSVGIAIGHYADHLQTLLQRSGDAERDAKKPRNALAVSFQAHSGGGDPRLVVHRWEDDPVRTHWATALEFHRHDTLPDGAAYELDTLCRELRTAHEHGVFASDDALRDLLIEETVRILKRKRPRHGAEEIQEEIVAAVQDRLEQSPDDTSPLEVLGSFVNEVIIARRIYRLLLDQRSEGVDLWNGPLRLIDVPTTAASAEARP